MNSIRILFPSLFAILILISVGIVATISLISQTREAKETAEIMLDLIGTTIDDHIYKNLSSAYNLTRIYAHLVQEGKTPLEHETLSPKFIRYMIDSVRSQSLMSRGLNLSVILPNGEGLTLDRRPTATPVVKLVDARKDGYLRWHSFDGYKPHVQPMVVEKTFFDPRNETAYQEAVRQRDTTTAPIHKTPLNREGFVVTVAEPVFDSIGTLKAVLSSDVDIRTIGIYLRGLKLPEGTVVIVFNAEGNLIASTLRQSDEAIGTQDLNRLPMLHTKEDPLIRETAASVIRNYGSYQVDQKRIFVEGSGTDRDYVYTAPLDNNFGLNWKLAVIIPEAGLIKNFVHGIHLTAWSTGGLVIVAILFGLGLATWVIRPILTLGEAAEALEKNQLLDPPLPVRELERDTLRKNEFGHLAKVFLRMIEEIRTRHKLLEIQLEQLRVDISHEDKHEELNAITQSDFFISLKARAAEMRNHRFKAIELQIEDSKTDINGLEDILEPHPPAPPPEEQENH
jgi:HAMP domain-containing protein